MEVKVQLTKLKKISHFFKKEMNIFYMEFS